MACCHPLAAAKVLFIVPAYPYSPTKRVAEMCVRWYGYVRAVMQMHVFGEMNIRIQ